MGRLWLVVTLPDGGGASVLVEDTDLVPDGEVGEGDPGPVEPAPGATVLSIEGVRGLRRVLSAGGGMPGEQR